MRWKLLPGLVVVSGLCYCAAPALEFSTLLGGSGQTSAQAVLLDKAGNIVVVGNTAAADFPTTPGSFQRIYAGGACGPEPRPCKAIFVSKFSADGSTLIFSTYIDGPGDDTAGFAALDAAGNVYITGTTAGSLPGLIPFPGWNLHSGTYVAKLSADGSKLLFNTLLPFDPLHQNSVAGIAVDSSGAVYLTGWSMGGIPAVNAFQGAQRAAQVFETSDSGAHWEGVLAGLPVSSVNAIAAAPSDSQVLYLALSAGLYKSADAGLHWSALPSLSVEPFSVVVDPVDARTVYVTSSSPPGIFKSIDGGQTWNSASQGAGRFVRMIAIDPNNTSTLYAAADDGLYKSLDGGNSWSTTSLMAPAGEMYFVHNVVIDPSNPSTLYAGTPEGVRKSTDGGVTWSLSAAGFTDSADVMALTIDPHHPQSLFASTPVVQGVYRSTDGGAHWTHGSWPTPYDYVLTLLVDPNLPSTVWAGTSGGLLVSRDGGVTWGWPSTTIPQQDVHGLAAAGGKIFAIETAINQPDAFALKLDPSATSIVYATYLGGTGSDLGQAIAADSSGRAYITGTTDSFDFPVSAAVQSHPGGRSDAFLAVLDPSGSRLAWSTYFGGSGNDTAASLALDASGNVHVAGTTESSDLPLMLPTQTRYGGRLDAWTATLKGDGSALLFATYFGGSGTDYATAVAADAAGTTYVVGSTNSPDLPVSGIQTSLAGVTNGFAVAWDGRTNAMSYSTYLGGSNVDYAFALAANDRGEAFVAGETLSHDFPLVYPFQAALAPCSAQGCYYVEAFLAVIGSARHHPRPPVLSQSPKHDRLP